MSVYIVFEGCQECGYGDVCGVFQTRPEVTALFSGADVRIVEINFGVISKTGMHVIQQAAFKWMPPRPELPEPPKQGPACDMRELGSALIDAGCKVTR